MDRLEDQREQTLFDSALSAFFLREEYKQGEGALFALAGAAFLAGWQAVRNASAEESKESPEANSRQ